MFTIIPEAQAEIKEACVFLEKQCVGLGVRYYHALEECFNRIAAMPLSYGFLNHPVSHRQYRRALLPKFRYAIIFTVSKQDIMIIAVAHTSRAPDYWFGRSA